MLGSALGDAIGELPRVVRQQTDALGSIQRQLEMGAETDAQLSGSMQSFGRSVDRLSESSEKGAHAVQDLHAATDEHHQRLDGILHRQTRHFTWLVAITAVLATAAIVLGVVAIVAPGGG